MQQGNRDFPTRKDSFNLVVTVCTAFQRAVTVPIRQFYGGEALGFPALWAFLLIVAWTAFSQDPLMVAWLGTWLASLVVRRLETGRMLRQGVQVHSRSDGTPTLAMLLSGIRNESVAKVFVEPLMLFLWRLCPLPHRGGLEAAGVGVGLLPDDRGGLRAGDRDQADDEKAAFAVDDSLVRLHFRLTMMGKDSATLGAWATSEDYVESLTRAKKMARNQQEALRLKTILDANAKLIGPPKTYGVFQKQPGE
jgi:hypothetical protein